MFDAVTNWDLSVLQAIFDGKTAFFDTVFPLITYCGEAVSMIVFALVLMAIPRTRRTGFVAGAALLIGVIVVNLVLKNAVARPRPYEIPGWEHLLRGLIKTPWDYSFPSGHALASFEVGASIFSRHRKVGIAAVVFALLISFSRLYLCVHYPSDVLAGIFLGIAFAALGAFLIGLVYKKWDVDRAFSKYDAKFPAFLQIKK